MEETISTPVEEVSADTSAEVVEETTTEPVEKEETAEIQQDGEQETEKLYAGKYKTVEELEKGYKEAEKSVNRVAELEKEVQGLKPRIVQEGQINPQFERQYQMQIDNQEYLTYDSLSRQLDNESRETVEKLLLEAKSLYNPNNKQAYNQKLTEIKNYFDSGLVEQIAVNKAKLQSQVKNEFQKAIQKDREERANLVARQIEEIPELKTLVMADSENFSPEVLEIVKQLHNTHNGLDLKLTVNAIKKIMDLGVKRHLAQEQAKQTTDNANVPTGEKVLQKTSTNMPTYKELVENPEVYKQAVKKFGMDKVDELIMKG